MCTINRLCPILSSDNNLLCTGPFTPPGILFAVLQLYIISFNKEFYSIGKTGMTVSKLPNLLHVINANDVSVTLAWTPVSQLCANHSAFVGRFIV